MPYGSANDLPTIKAMRQQLAFARLLGGLLGREGRATMKDVRRQLDELTDTVDSFYQLLGSRHWIFHDDLSVPDLASLVREHDGDPDEAEAAFIAWYKSGDRLEHMIRRLSWHEAWRARLPLMWKALEDYKAERYYAVVHVLLSVMEGFVNDLYPANRKALSAREPDEMDAWDSVVGHHEGLASAHQTFRRQVKARSEEPTFELNRNGLVHGMLVNYDNDVVATKAWNRLFAVSDWARSLDKMRQAATEPPTPSLRESLDKLANVREERKAIDRFNPKTLHQGDPDFEAHPVFQATQKYLEAWSRKNYGSMASQISTMFNVAIGPAKVRAEYADQTLDSFTVERVAEDGIATCDAFAALVINGVSYRPRIRWGFEDAGGKVAIPTMAAGDWRLVMWGSGNMVQNWEGTTDEPSV